MTMIGALLDRFVLVALIVMAGAVPSFVQQYRQQVNGRLEQATTDLQPFVSIANQRHSGDVQALIGHHVASSDATFVREGQAIGSMVEAVQSLNGANAALDAPLLAQAWYLVRHVDRDIAMATWRLFEPAFALTVEGVVFALSVGTALWLVLLGCGRLLAATWRTLASPRSVAR